MTPQIIQQLLERNSNSRKDLTKLIDSEVYDVQWKNIYINSSGNLELSFKTKKNFMGYVDKDVKIFRSQNKYSELVEIHYCLLMLEKRTLSECEK